MGFRIFFLLFVIDNNLSFYYMNLNNLHLLYYIDQITHIDFLLLIARVDRKRITASSKSGGCLLIDFFEWLQLMRRGIYCFCLHLSAWRWVTLETGGVKLLNSFVVVSTVLWSRYCGWRLHESSLLLVCLFSLPWLFDV